MLFHSFEFIVFFLCVYTAYRMLPHRAQNILLLIASYVFYASWDWRFLSLILISTLVDYVCGLRIDSAQNARTRRHFLCLSLGVNLSLLGIFKYFNFFADNLAAVAGWMGWHVSPATLNVVLPVGISFYTFQTLSYTIDIYRGRMKPTRDFWNFALFVAFFPQLVAGPIERASQLLPQIERPRRPTLDQFYEGCYLFFWGLFLKMFVADKLAVLVDPIFANEGARDAGQVWIGMVGFTFQIFGDFAGYSNMARGVARLLGIDLVNNFLAPFFAANPREFWHRWHISLSTWLRDYLYIPLGGNRGAEWMTQRNLWLTMLLGGLWHGAAWTFVIWGMYHGALLMGHRWWSRRINLLSSDSSSRTHRLVEFCKIAVFFQFTCLGFLIFRAQSLDQLIRMFSALIRPWRGVDIPAFKSGFWELVFCIFVVSIIQLIQYLKNDELAVMKFGVIARAIVYVVVFYLILVHGVTGGKEFIYFQF